MTLNYNLPNTAWICDSHSCSDELEIIPAIELKLTRHESCTCIHLAYAFIPSDLQMRTITSDSSLGYSSTSAARQNAKK